MSEALRELINAGVVDDETVSLLVRCILDVAERQYGEVRLTIKGGELTHVSSTFSYAARKGHGSNPEPTMRSKVGARERKT